LTWLCLKLIFFSWNVFFLKFSESNIFIFLGFHDSLLFSKEIKTNHNGRHALNIMCNDPFPKWGCTALYYCCRDDVVNKPQDELNWEHLIHLRESFHRFFVLLLIECTLVFLFWSILFHLILDIEKHCSEC